MTQPTEETKNKHTKEIIITFIAVLVIVWLVVTNVKFGNEQQPAVTDTATVKIDTAKVIAIDTVKTITPDTTKK